MSALRTARLQLREWRDDDRDDWAAMNADPEVMEYFPAPLDRAQADAAFDRIQAALAARGWGLWAVEHDGRFLGFTGLAPVGFEAPFAPATEIGWRLRRDAWGQGFATEAAREAMRFAFDELGLPQLVSLTSVTNARSRAVMARLGMTHDPADDFDHPNVPHGSPLRPHVLYRALAQGASQPPGPR
ncbi:GNAT family N-acetyltransferase [Pseudolysinimonas yzui]|uniref:N-acetyltransferase n=1 Tax=Pseudolysinimonas yzui TaxID=2708254 RepID=A0A8J3GT55_9MICO|nr:GNAT family N-acetyltransferase [Pseudolysinimonas yzui]GHF24885.1 N-acetyltransferase [Pseudolysinimonas yzui]